MMDKEHRKILLTGANGLLGQKTTEIFARESEHELVLTDSYEKPKN
jgi:nucleoside-diphosphate-sugar epimerase